MSDVLHILILLWPYDKDLGLGTHGPVLGLGLEGPGLGLGLDYIADGLAMAAESGGCSGLVV